MCNQDCTSNPLYRAESTHTIFIAKQHKRTFFCSINVILYDKIYVYNFVLQDVSINPCSFIVNYYCQSSDFNLFFELIINVRIDLLLIAIIILFEFKKISVQYVQYVLHIKFFKSCRCCLFITLHYSYENLSE